MEEVLNRIRLLRDQRRTLELEIQVELERQFLYRSVRVNHGRGSFTGLVVRCGADGLNVYVRNDVTGKVSPRYVLGEVGETPEIELIGGPAHG